MPAPKRGVADLSDAERTGSSFAGPPASNSPSGAARELPEQFGRYRIIQQLGQGGMGSVYLAEDTQLGRRVALKVSDLAGSPEGLKRFEREARALAALDHPSICHVYDYGVLGGVPFLIMAYIAGGSLAGSIPGGGMSPHQAAALVHDLAVAMQEAHAHGILHRDLKPMNVMMKPTGAGFVPVIVDFGLARRDDSAEEALTATGRGMGTIYYMPLEQINGDLKAIGPACDVYALGIILYELLTGRRPFQGTYAEIVAQKLSQTPEPPSTLRAGIDPRLETICLKAMAREIKDRYASMAELAKALADVLNATTEPFSVPKPPLAETILLPRDQPPAPPRREGERIVASPLAKKGRDEGWPPSWRKVALAASCGGLLLLGIIIYVTTDKGRVKINLGEQKGPVNLVVERDGKKVADISVEPSPPTPVGKSSVPVEPRPAPSSSPASPPSAESNVAPSAPAPVKDWTSPFTKMKLALIPAGSFEMGSPDDDKKASSDEKPRHRVTISRPFYMGVYEVTQGECQQVMGENPSYFSPTGEGKDRVQGQATEKLPVECVSWFDAVKFCNALSAKEGRRPYYKIEGEQVTILGGTGYRLPTEAEWEYACRAGSTTRYSFGDDPAPLGSFAWFADNSGRDSWDASQLLRENGYDYSKLHEEVKRHGCGPHPVGQKLPNKWGLYDMQGNVWEWCQDWYLADYYGSSPATDPAGPAKASGRVHRGGCWDNDPRGCRPACRNRVTPVDRNSALGFRLAADQQ